MQAWGRWGYARVRRAGLHSTCQHQLQRGGGAAGDPDPEPDPDANPDASAKAETNSPPASQCRDCRWLEFECKKICYDKLKDMGYNKLYYWMDRPRTQTYGFH